MSAKRFFIVGAVPIAVATLVLTIFALATRQWFGGALGTLLLMVMIWTIDAVRR